MKLLKFTTTMTRVMMVILSALITSGCIFGNVPNGWDSMILPPGVANTFPDYDESNPYQKGFIDGCKTFTSIVGQGIMRTIPIHIDGWKLTNKNPLTGQYPHPEIIEGETYRVGFNDGMEHCTYTIDWNII